MRNIKSLLCWIFTIVIVISTNNADTDENESIGHKHKHCFDEKEIVDTIQIVRKQFADDYNEASFEDLGKYYTKTNCRLIIRDGDYDSTFDSREDIIEKFYVQAKVYAADLMRFEVVTAIQLSPTRAYSIEQVTFESALIGPNTIQYGSSMAIWKFGNEGWQIEKHVITIPVDIRKNLDLFQYKERNYKK